MGWLLLFPAYFFKILDAETGFAPASSDYEPDEKLLLYSAKKASPIERQGFKPDNKDWGGFIIRLKALQPNNFPSINC